jgi:hypothetical protein
MIFFSILLQTYVDLMPNLLINFLYGTQLHIHIFFIINIIIRAKHIFYQLNVLILYIYAKNTFK